MLLLLVLLVSAAFALWLFKVKEKRENTSDFVHVDMDLVPEPGFSTVEEFRYLTESEFRPDTMYEFESPFGGTFDSMVGQDLDKNGKPSGYFWTLAENRMCYKAASIRCRLK